MATYSVLCQKVMAVIFLNLVLNLYTQAQSLRGEEARRWQAGLDQVRSGNTAQALSTFKNFLDRNPEPGLFIQAGNALVGQGGFAQAEELYLWGRRKLKQPRAFADRLADIYQCQQRYDRAVAEWCRVLPEQSDIVAAKLNEIAQYIGWERTAILAESALGPEAGDKGRIVLIDLHLKAGDEKRAWRHFVKMTDVKQLRRSVDRFSAAGVQPEIQARVFEEYLGRTGYGDVERMERLGAIYLAMKNYRQAAAVYDRLMPFSRPRAIVGKARAELAQSRPREALRILDELREPGLGERRDSLYGEASFIKADAWFRSGEENRALAIWRSLAEDSALTVNHRCQASYRLGEQFLGIGEVDSALAYYRRAAKLGLAGDLGNDALMRLLLISEGRGATIEGLKLFGQGLYAKHRDDRQKAASCFERVHQEYPGTVLADQALLELSLMCQEAGELVKAVESWSRLASEAGDPLLSCRAAYQQGWLLKYRLGRPEKAEEIFKQAILKYPDYSWSDLMRLELEK